MKKRILILSLVFCAFYSYSQQLGFSTFSSFGGNSSSSDHEMYHNVGEALVNRADTDLSALNGLMQNLAQNHYQSNTIRVRFFYDEDENGVKDAEERYLQLGGFSVNNTVDFVNYSSEGVFINTPNGSYTISYKNLGPAGDWFLTTDDNLMVDVDDAQNFFQFEFGLAPEEQVSIVNTYMTSDRLRCFSKVDQELLVVNNGTVVEESVVWLELDELFEEFYFTIPPDFEQGNLVGWNFSLGPTESFKIPFCVKAPGVSDELPPGSYLISKAWVETADRGEQFCFDQELRCSWDPNDKLVNPNRPDSLGLLDQPITYTLRFQNTGNDYAEDVVVTDTISQSLDMTTFQVLSTSHPDLLQVEINRADPHIVNFRFENIFLPDSTENLEGSNGHILYTISPKEGLPLNTEINNTGFIYFDFNPAVITNTTSTTLVDEYPIVATEDEEEESLAITIFPNPTNGLIYLDKIVEQVTVSDLYGKRITDIYNTKKIDLRQMTPATYLLDMRIGDMHQTEKVVLLK